MRMPGASTSVVQVLFSPDGKHLALGDSESKVSVWNHAERKLVSECRIENGWPMLYSAVHGRLAGRNVKRSGDDALDKAALQVWDSRSGEVMFTLRGHTDLVTCMALAPDGRRFASAGRDRTVRLWDLLSGKELHVLRGHADVLTSLAFSPDGKRLASASNDKTIKLWDPATGREALTLRGH